MFVVSKVSWLFISLAWVSLIHTIHAQCTSTSDVENVAICQIAAGFSPLPAILSSTWQCDLNSNPIGNVCSWPGIGCNPGCSIVAINLGNANIVGTLSSSIGQLTNLLGLFLYNNQIRGTVPASIVNLNKLELLEIDNNQFTGVFPITMCNGAAVGIAPSPIVPMGLVKLQLFQADYNNFYCMPYCLFRAKPQNYGLWAMATWSSGAVYIDPSAPQCASQAPTRTPSMSKAPTSSPKPTYTAAPSTATPSKTPTTPAQFKWQAGVYWGGGSINTNVTSIYNVYYGNWAMTAAGTYSNRATAAIIDRFTTDIGQSTWYKILSTYWDSSPNVPTGAVFKGSFFVNTSNYLTSINQYDIESLILFPNIRAGLIAATPGFENNCYNFLPSEDVRIDRVQLPYATADCSSVCGFHSYVSVNVGGIGTRIKYTVQANQASKNTLSVQCGCTWYGSGLMNFSPNGNYIADSFIYIMSHEIAELVTDTARGWNNCLGCTGENGDLCIWRPGASYTGDFLYYPTVNSFGNTVYGNVQVGSSVYHVNPLWVNYGHGCCATSWPFTNSHGEIYLC